MDVAQCWMRPANAADLAAVAGFAEMTFRDTYAAHNTPEDMELYCSQAYAPEVLAAEMHQDDVLYLLALVNDHIVGLLKLQWSQPPMPMPFDNPLQISRIYVHPEAKGQGIGRILMAAAKAHAAEHGHDYLWLGVWQQNEAAIAFYKKMGFAIIGTDTFVLGKDPQLDWLMGLPMPKH